MTAGEDLWSYEALRRRWEQTHDAEQKAYRRPKKIRRARGAEVIAALKEQLCRLT
jgi:hypothetical protein